MARPVHVFVGSCGGLSKKKEKVHVETDEELLKAYKKSFKPTSKVELTISCKNLPSTHILRGTSDPFCVVSVKRPWQERYVEIARTETIENSLEPEWFKKILLDYSFEAIQHIQFEVRDKDLDDHDFLGRYHTTLGALVSSHGRQVHGKMIGKIDGEIIRDKSEIIVVTEEVSSCKQVIEIQFACENLPKRKWFRNNDPYLVISRMNEDDSYSVVTRTKVAESSQNPEWDPLKIRVSALCNGDFDRKIKIDCFSDRGSGHHKLIGSCFTSINELNIVYQEEKTLTLINEEKQKSIPNYVDSGILKVIKNSMAQEITFLDYILGGGTQMHFAVAIDFTSSNGVHTDSNSLHYLCDEKMNNYELALRGVGETLQHYDSDQLFPAFGLICFVVFYVFFASIELFFLFQVLVQNYHVALFHSSSR